MAIMPCTNTSSYDISIIQGDDLAIVYQFIDSDGKPLDDTTIATAYVTCVELPYQTTLTYNAIYKGWELSISSNESNLFQQGVYTYDLTIYFINAIVQTELYQAKFTVLLKRNKVVT